jgi:hypothetical protein
MIDDPEEEAWRELERRIRRAPVSMTVALEAYLKNRGFKTASDVEVERHFQAGWMAAVRNHRESND